MEIPGTAPKPGESGWLWLIKLFSGLAIIVLLIVHFIVNHFVAEGGLLNHADVVAYYTNPWIVLMEAAFLVFVISHALIGFRSIVLDLGPSSRVLRIFDVALILIGITSTVYGVWILQTVATWVS